MKADGPHVAETVRLNGGLGPSVRVAPVAYADFDLAMAEALAKLVERWLPLAAPDPARLRRIRGRR
jgi:hypothetical protein